MSTLLRSKTQQATSVKWYGTQSWAIKQAYWLMERWIGTTEIRAGKGYDLDRIHASMLHEYRYQRTRADRKGVTSEIRGELVMLGKIRKALAA